MRTTRLAPLLFALAALAPLSCARDAGELVPRGYRSWSRSTDKELNYPVPGHLDNYRIIYVNDKGGQYVAGSQGERRSITYPPGAVFVKEVYSGSGRPAPGAAPAMLTVMIKAPDDPRAHRGWLFLTKNPASGMETVIEQPFCADCHAAAGDRHTYGDGNPDGELRDCVYIVPKRGP